VGCFSWLIISRLLIRSIASAVVFVVLLIRLANIILGVLKQPPLFLSEFLLGLPIEWVSKPPRPLLRASSKFLSDLLLHL
jgi:hypothetical protein